MSVDNPKWILRAKSAIHDCMKIAFMHYHLKTGGVTSVIRQQLEAVKGACETLVLTGEPPEAAFPAQVAVVPELGYSGESQKSLDARAAADAVLAAIHSRFGGPCDILHVHNPTLAKNRQLLAILKCLQQKGVRLLLQIHDFAEDGRPHAYCSEQYPADCHYAVINLRDYGILLQAGLEKKGLHRLANSVWTYTPRPDPPKAGSSMVLYPIRAIRRKNIGEAILLSLFFKTAQSLAITLPPNSPMDIESYRGWKSEVAQLKLNVAFDVGLDHDFEKLVAAADFIITTSITEGFGFCFLEPWLFGKLLWGRRLPAICRDFERHGIDLDRMYTALRVPLSWVGADAFHEKWCRCVAAAGVLFNHRLEAKRIKTAYEKITRDGAVDFGLLDETFQKKIIRRLAASPRDADRLAGMNPFLTMLPDVREKSRRIETNRQAILKNYGPDAYRRQLIRLYHKVVATDVRHKIDKAVLVEAFLDLEQFSLLKWSDYRE